MANWSDVRELFVAVPLSRQKLTGPGRILLPLAVIACLSTIGAASSLAHESAAIAAMLVVVLLAAWSCGPRWALWFALVAAVSPALGRPWQAVDVSVAIVARLGIFLVAGLVVALLRTAIERGNDFAERDRLTGLFNRVGFMKCLESESNRALRSGWPLAVAFLDCDNFKEVNDAQGHLAGDAVLRLTADTIAANIRNYDAAARFGGDEFVILWPIRTAAGGEVAANRLHKILSDTMDEAGWPVTFSIGVAVFDRVPDAERMITLADGLMYDAKRSGKGRVRVETFREPPANETQAKAT